MDTKLLKSFLKDHIVDSIAFFGANVLIGVFYSIVAGRRLEVTYPLLIVIFVYLVWMLIHFVKYHRLFKDLEAMAIYPDFERNLDSEMNKQISNTMKRLHLDYLDKLSESDNNRKKERRFLSLWVHNMKTPVTVTDLLLQRMEKNTGELTTEIQSLQEENKKLLSNLDTVLNIIRMEEFAKDYIPEPMNLLTELKSIINKNKSLFIYSRVFPKILTDLEQTDILSDRKWNELMISQIISNGVKYSKDVSGESKNLYFMIEKIDTNIVLTIRDEGIGIPEYDLGKVCDPFFTGDNGRKGYQSSGIGLYFCKEVGKLLGHTLGITSEVNKGTSVTITYLAKL